MAEKPILFSTEMVRAILGGRKTQTRRVIKPQPLNVVDDDKALAYAMSGSSPLVGRFLSEVIKDATYAVGDILLVWETWARRECEGLLREGRCYPVSCDCRYAYRADYDTTALFKWRPSTHMPRAAARIFLRVTDVRAERLGDISGDDVLAEGVENGKSNPTMGVRWQNMQRMAFAELWDSINAKHGYGWDANPWCWVYEFERIK